MSTIASNNWESICLGMFLNDVSQFSVSDARLHWKEKERAVRKGRAVGFLVARILVNTIPSCLNLRWRPREVQMASKWQGWLKIRKTFFNAKKKRTPEGQGKHPLFSLRTLTAVAQLVQLWPSTNERSKNNWFSMYAGIPQAGSKASEGTAHQQMRTGRQREDSLPPHPPLFLSLLSYFIQRVQ